jgi:hypothetical protein
VPVTRAKNSDACVVVYSISDRTSFKAAHEALAALQASSSQRKSFEDDNKEEQEINPAPLSVPVVLLANKKDLGHLRQVSRGESNWRNNPHKNKTKVSRRTRARTLLVSSRLLRRRKRATTAEKEVSHSVDRVVSKIEMSARECNEPKRACVVMTRVCNGFYVSSFLPC